MLIHSPITECRVLAPCRLLLTSHNRVRRNGYRQTADKNTINAIILSKNIIMTALLDFCYTTQRIGDRLLSDRQGRLKQTLLNKMNILTMNTTVTMTATHIVVVFIPRSIYCRDDNQRSAAYYFVCRVCVVRLHDVSYFYV